MKYYRMSVGSRSRRLSKLRRNVENIAAPAKPFYKIPTIPTPLCVHILPIGPCCFSYSLFSCATASLLSHSEFEEVHLCFELWYYHIASKEINSLQTMRYDCSAFFCNDYIVSQSLQVVLCSLQVVTYICKVTDLSS